MATYATYFFTLSLHDALPISLGVAGGAARVAHRRGLVLVPHVELDRRGRGQQLLVVVDLLARRRLVRHLARPVVHDDDVARSEEHTSELQSREKIVCRLLLEK